MQTYILFHAPVDHAGAPIGPAVSPAILGPFDSANDDIVAKSHVEALLEREGSTYDGVVFTLLHEALVGKNSFHINWGPGETMPSQLPTQALPEATLTPPPPPPSGDDASSPVSASPAAPAEEALAPPAQNA